MTIMQTQEIPENFPATVLSNQMLLDRPALDVEVREIVLEVEQARFDAKVGQSMGVLAPMHGEGERPFHLRWYSIADLPGKSDAGNPTFTICVRRHLQKDPVTGLVHRGITSNYLCDLDVGDHVRITGPRGLAFEVPEQHDATLLLIGAGPGIAPFRAFVKHLHQEVKDWQGTVRVFFGSRTGLETLYGNDPDSDIGLYFDDATFTALQALSPKPNWADPLSWDLAYSERGAEFMELLQDPKTYVYVGGLKAVGQHLDELFSKLYGSPDTWASVKSSLMAEKRWVEFLYGQ
jgi:ferredoxin--NADP+ reductase